MKIKCSIGFIILFISSFSVFAQTEPSASPTPSRPRVVVSNNLPTPTITPTPRPTPMLSASPTPTNRPVVVVSNSPMPVTTPTPTSPVPFGTPFPTPTPRPTPLPSSYKMMTYGQMKARIQQAKSFMQSRPMSIAQVDSLSTEYVRLAVFDWKKNEIDYIVMSKAVFLVTNAEFPITTAGGKSVFVKVIRANGVNTPVLVFDEASQPLTPLVIQYPIERNGAFAEMAYYTSTHTGLVVPEVINAGKMYIKNAIDIAREKLREKGIFIQPQIANIAERLATVEHVDHARFRNEYHLNIYNDIFTLFALNEGNTYRYSVSRAGAGGMVQMIPSTYFMVRNRYYSVGLMPDFVEGMRNHVNACQAMLLYMQWTWDDLISRETIYNAIENGTATQAELMAAGYNSNPANLAKYIKRGGNGWRNLIPRETRIYLQIYASLERFIPMQSRLQ